jgi:hypothetical protein
MAVVPGLGVQVIRAAADEIFWGDRLACHHTISTG